MIISEKYTLFRRDGIERACVRLKRMQITDFGRNTLLNLADALETGTCSNQKSTGTSQTRTEA